MATKVECNINVGHNLIGAYAMNQIVRDIESDEHKVALVDLWTEAQAMKRELNTLRSLIEALPTNNNLPY